jgi:hypothetical protein
MEARIGRRASFLWPLALLACGKPKTAQAVAETFIDRYYIERDHAKALELATGIAAARVQEEKRLVEEGRAAGAGDSAVQPHVYYTLRKISPRGADVELTYDLTIDSGGTALKKELRLVATRAGDAYKVGFFNETDLN